jgi:hypothetical protein
MLSLHRLAPVQIQFGIGHPISSGSGAIDYSIVSESMLHEYQRIHATLDVSRRGIDSCLQDLQERNMSARHLSVEQVFSLEGSVAFSGPHREETGSRIESCELGIFGPNAVTYTEQLVQFQSLGAVICFASPSLMITLSEGYYLHDSMEYTEEVFDPLEVVRFLPSHKLLTITCCVVRFQLLRPTVALDRCLGPRRPTPRRRTWLR